MINYGATLFDWQALSDIAGLTSELLPIVSNPNAIKHPKSELDTVGKVPCRYVDGMFMGIGSWPTKQTEQWEVEQWSKEPDYGIGLQCRTIRAIDIDIPDQATSDRVRAALYACGLPNVPLRYRAGTGKCLLAFRVVGEFYKRAIVIEEGLIEFLATGNQFVAVGTHKSSTRYEWVGGTPMSFPEISAELYLKCWDTLTALFPNGKQILGKAKRIGIAADSVTALDDDPVAQHLLDSDLFRNLSRDGHLNITCPFESEHTSDSGDSSTQYRPASTGGYKGGHFICLHTHCKDRTNDDFKIKLGLPVWEREALDTSTLGFGVAPLPPITIARDATPVVADPYVTPVARVISGSRLATPADQYEKLFRGCVYVGSENKILTPGGWLLDKQRFENMIGGYSFIMNNDNAGAPSKSAWEAFLQNQAYECPKADSLCFRPESPPGVIFIEGGQRLVNIWWPVDTLRVEGDTSAFISHMERLLPVESDRVQLISYMAAIVQYPGVKFQWCPVIQGCEGNGKSFLSACIEYAIGDRYTHKPNASEIGSKFTGWLRGKLFISVEEVMVAGHKLEVLDALKPLVTNPRIEMQSKGQDQTTGDNRANFLMFTNHKNAIPVDVDKRRYAIYYTAQQEAKHLTRDGMGGKYFPKLYDWARSGGYAHIAHYLSKYTIPDELNPAVACHRAPITSSTSEAIHESLGALEQDILECIESGEMGFKGGWVSTTMLARKFEKRGVSLRRMATALQRLGYIHHPSLHDGRCNNPVAMPDGNRPRLYVKPDHSSIGVENQNEISRMYSSAQTGFGQSQ